MDSYNILVIMLSISLVAFLIAAIILTVIVIKILSRAYPIISRINSITEKNEYYLKKILSFFNRT